jgi:glucosamine-6-phosphate deaminase
MAGGKTLAESRMCSQSLHLPMKLRVFADKHALGSAAAEQAAAALKTILAQNGRCRLLAATGGSQFEFLAALTALPGIAWENVEMFHLDEYVGLSASHPASFRKYLLERLIAKTGIRNHHLIDGEKDPAQTCRELGALISAAPIDLAFAGIGENGHLAFNDPPADFTTEEPYLVVDLDEACRRQQVGEGWFGSIDEVPRQAISISVRQLLKARILIVPVPDARKAAAVQRCLEGPISPEAPASILRQHADTTIYLDQDSAGLLSPANVQGT